ncbi:PQQ-dependent sugar dehydrogenase [Loktanella sp. SALINAS62]|uniref:PQQ-dependent sugar dehydrogenase n=1 Tax=Loktanella sp. SALINAS62 TaxID=2706124 RepID=UPI001B8AF402|nr:PQQ-dependent sugar dehydrogenase [Loktanella sp. SALINAS62]MBS1302802.1 sorbosone dehydrogenase [Loktanella sp. SALINAS62]
MTARIILTTSVATAMFTLPAFAQDDGPDPIPSASATPTEERTVGLSFVYTMDQAPQPYTGPAVNNTPLTLTDTPPRLNLPDGFSATLFAQLADAPRQVEVLPNGDVLVAHQSAGYIGLLRDTNGDGQTDTISRYAEPFTAPYGVHYRDGVDGPQILVADVQGIWAMPYTEDRIRIVGAETKPVTEVPKDERVPQHDFSGQQMITPEGAFGDGPFGHVNRDIAIGDDGTLYVGIGSNGNISVEPGVPATIQAFAPDGALIGTVATGVRNPAGLAIHPDTGDLFAVVQERDGTGDDLVPDFLINVQQDAFYGWPYAYIGQNPQPGFADLAPDQVAATVTPDLLFQPHSATMDLEFPEDPSTLPAQYRDGAFIAFKGSWNRTQPTGYKVVFAPFENGMPVGTYENFATGFWVENDQRAEVWGRPVDVEFGPDGAMFIADDTGNTIWRVTYDGDLQDDAAEDTQMDAAPQDDADTQADDSE